MLRLCVAGLLMASLTLTGCSSQPTARLAVLPDSTEEAYRGSVTALSWPGSTRAYQVTSSGDLFNGGWFVRMEPSSSGLTADAPPVIAYEDRWCPVVHWTRQSGTVRWDFEAVAFPTAEPAPWEPAGLFARMAAARAREADRALELEALRHVAPARLAQLTLRVQRPIERNSIDRRNVFVSLLVTATNTGSQTSDARLELECSPPTDPPPYYDPDSLVRTPFDHCWNASSHADSMLGVGTGLVDGRRMVVDWKVRPGQRASTRLVLPAYPTPAGALQKIFRVPHETRLAATRSYWNREMSRGAIFDLPDTVVQRAIFGARVVLLSSRERRDVDWVPIGSPFQYRDIWVRDGARVIEALAVSGYTRESRELAHSFLRFQAPTGTFVSQTGQLDGTGQAIWAFEQSHLRPRPSGDAHRYAAAALVAVRGLEDQRRTTRQLGAIGAGMLPPTDPHDGELVRGQLVGNDAWALVAYRGAAALLRASGRVREADSVDHWRARYLMDFEANMARLERPDLPPAWQSGGHDWGNLNVGYPCGVLAPQNPRLVSLSRRYWSRAGGPGLGYYGNTDSLHTYVAVDLATLALLRGNRSEADSVLSATLHWRTASGAAAEMFSGSNRDFGRNFPPHTTAAAALLSLVRNSLIFDDGDTLALTLGARTRWWQGSRIERAPTRWGLVDLQFSRTADVATWRWSRVPVWTQLALPPGTRPAHPLVHPLRPGTRPDVVLAPPGTSHVELAVISE